MKAVDVALAWLTRGDLNVGQGWMNRARRLLDGAPADPAIGYLAYLDAYIATIVGDTEALARQAETLRELSARLDTPAMFTLCLVVDALAAIDEARMAEAFGLIDEAMLTVMADEIPVEWAGDIYCLVLHHCTAWPTSRACGRGRSRCSGGVRTPVRRCTAACAKCIACIC